jgi:hypothetical protein
MMNNAILKEQGFALQQALGSLVVEFARFETTLGCAVGYLATPKEPRVGQILVAELSFKARLAAFAALYPERKAVGGNEDRLKSFVLAAHRVEEQRNVLIHSFYRLGPVGDSSAIRIKPTAKGRKGLKIQFETVKAESIAAEARRVSRVSGLLTQLMVKFNDYTRYASGFYDMFKPAVIL